MQTSKMATALLLLASMVGCNSEKQNGPFEIVTLQEETLPPVQPLKLEKIDINEDYTMGDPQCWIYHDSVLVVLKWDDPYPLKKMLTLVNLNTGNIIAEYFTNGRGPGELLGALGRLSNNRLDICGCQLGRLVSVNLDSAIMHGNAYKPILINCARNDFSEWGALEDTLFLTVNDYYFDGENALCKANSQLPEFYWFGKNGKSIPEYNDSLYEVKYRVQDISRLTISINKKRNRVVCCNLFRPYIKVLDLDLNPIRKIVGPEPDDGKYVVEEFTSSLFWDNKNYGRNDYYSVPSCDDENIFVTNHRTHRYKQEGNDINAVINGYLKVRLDNAEIFRFDWDGNLIARYNAKGRHIWGFTYSKNSNTLYLQAKGEDGEFFMYKAKL